MIPLFQNESALPAVPQIAAGTLPGTAATARGLAARARGVAGPDPDPLPDFGALMDQPVTEDTQLVAATATMAAPQINLWAFVVAVSPAVHAGPVPGPGAHVDVPDVAVKVSHPPDATADPAVSHADFLEECDRAASSSEALAAEMAIPAQPATTSPAGARSSLPDGNHDGRSALIPTEMEPDDAPPSKRNPPFTEIAPTPSVTSSEVGHGTKSTDAPNPTAPRRSAQGQVFSAADPGHAQNRPDSDTRSKTIQATAPVLPSPASTALPALPSPVSAPPTPNNIAPALHRSVAPAAGFPVPKVQTLPVTTQPTTAGLPPLTQHPVINLPDNAPVPPDPSVVLAGDVSNGPAAVLQVSAVETPAPNPIVQTEPLAVSLPELRAITSAMPPRSAVIAAVAPDIAAALAFSHWAASQSAPMAAPMPRPSGDPPPNLRHTAPPVPVPSGSVTEVTPRETNGPATAFNHSTVFQTPALSSAAPPVIRHATEKAAPLDGSRLLSGLPDTATANLPDVASGLITSPPPGYRLNLRIAPPGSGTVPADPGAVTAPPVAAASVPTIPGTVTGGRRAPDLADSLSHSLPGQPRRVQPWLNAPAYTRTIVPLRPDAEKKAPKLGMGIGSTGATDQAADADIRVGGRAHPVAGPIPKPTGDPAPDVSAPNFAAPQAAPVAATVLEPSVPMDVARKSAEVTLGELPQSAAMPSVEPPPAASAGSAPPDFGRVVTLPPASAIALEPVNSIAIEPVGATRSALRILPFVVPLKEFARTDLQPKLSASRADPADKTVSALPQPAPPVMLPTLTWDSSNPATAPRPLGDPGIPSSQTTPATVTPVASTPIHQAPITVTVSQDAAGRIEMHLDPVELGRVRMEITASTDRIQIHLAVERPDSLDLLRRHGEQLLHEFRQAGLAGGTLSFGSWGQSAQQQRPTPAAPPAHAPLLSDPPPSLATQLRTQSVGTGLNLRL